MTRNRLIALILGWLLAAVGVESASAASGSPSSAEQAWHFSFMLYGWVPGVSADVDAGDASASVNNDPINILDDLNAAIMVHAEVSKRPFSVIADYIYISFKDGSVGPRGASGFDLSGSVFDLAGTLRVGEWPMGRSGKVALEPLVGGRFYDLDLGLDLGAQHGSVSKQWTDPVVGFRTILDFDEHWRLTFRGDVGGFGVGSDFTFLADASISYAFSNGIFLALGYRALGLDFDEGSGNDSFKFSGILHGPYIGLGINF